MLVILASSQISNDAHHNEMNNGACLLASKAEVTCTSTSRTKWERDLDEIKMIYDIINLKKKIVRILLV